MKGIHTHDGSVTAQFPASRDGALAFMGNYLRWAYVAKIESGRVVIEEVGRNTRKIFGFSYEGSSEEILPLAQFLYLYTALGVACFCAPDPEWMKNYILETIKMLESSPKEARVPLGVACSCIYDLKFKHLKEMVSGHVPMIPESVLLEPGSIFSDQPWSILPGHHSEIAMMLVSGISKKEDIVAGIRAVADSYMSENPIQSEDLLAAAGLTRDGSCSFAEALDL